MLIEIKNYLLRLLGSIHGQFFATFESLFGYVLLSTFSLLSTCGKIKKAEILRIFMSMRKKTLSKHKANVFRGQF